MQLIGLCVSAPLQSLSLFPHTDESSATSLTHSPTHSLTHSYSLSMPCNVCTHATLPHSYFNPLALSFTLLLLSLSLYFSLFTSLSYSYFISLFLLHHIPLSLSLYPSLSHTLSLSLSLGSVAVAVSRACSYSGAVQQMLMMFFAAGAVFLRMHACPVSLYVPVLGVQSSSKFTPFTSDG